MEDRIKIDLHEGVADVRLTRADKMNALDDAMFDFATSGMGGHAHRVPAIPRASRLIAVLKFWLTTFGLNPQATPLKFMRLHPCTIRVDGCGMAI